MAEGCGSHSAGESLLMHVRVCGPVQMCVLIVTYRPVFALQQALTNAMRY